MTTGKMSYAFAAKYDHHPITSTGTRYSSTSRLGTEQKRYKSKTSENTLSTCNRCLAALDLGDVKHKVYQPVAVPPFVVVPRHDLDEGRVKHDPCLRVKHRGAAVVYKVLAYNVLNHVQTREPDSIDNAARTVSDRSDSYYLG